MDALKYNMGYSDGQPQELGLITKIGRLYSSHNMEIPPSISRNRLIILYKHYFVSAQLQHIHMWAPSRVH